MAFLTKPVDLLLPGAERYLVVTNTDLANGDTLRVFDSLLKAGRMITITASAGSDLSIQFNNFKLIAPPRNNPRYDVYASTIGGETNLATAFEMTMGTPSITIGAASAATYTQNATPVNFLTVKYTTGTFTITVQ